MARNTDTRQATQWHKDQRQNRILSYNNNRNCCARCHKVLTYDEGLKKFCSRSCSASFNNQGRVPGKFCKKACLLCGLETKNQFCSTKCMWKFRTDDLINKWLNNETITESEDIPLPIRRYMLEQSGEKCSRCGWCEINQTTGKSPLSIDHIDGNSRNHSKDNLRVLCPNCHSLTPTYGALNKGNGRKKRYKYKPDNADVV